MGIRKKILIGILVAAGAVAGTWGILTAVRNGSRKPVKVYDVSEVAQTDYWADQQETYGTVSSDQVQNVFLTSTQTVSSVFVQKGQTVKKGDPLLAYDTTLSQINIEKAENDLNQQKRNLDLARKELDKMQKTKPAPDGKNEISPSVIDGGDDNGGDIDNGNGENEDPGNGEGGNAEHGGNGESRPEEKESHDYELDTNYQGEKIGKPKSYDTPALLDGVGTTDKPAIWIWGEGNRFSDELLKEMFNKTLEARKKAESEENQKSESSTSDQTETKQNEKTDENRKTGSDEKTESRTESDGSAFPDSDHDCYLVLRQYMENNPGHKKIAEHGIHLNLDHDRLMVSLFNPDLLKVRKQKEASSVPEITAADSSLTDSGIETEGEDGSSGIISDEFSEDGSEEDYGTETVGDGTDSRAESTASDNETDYSTMTRSELNKAVSDQKIKIRDQEIVEKLAEIKLRQMKHELSDGIVRSTIDGVVKNVRDPEKAYEQNKACISVSNGGGYTIECSISELSISDIKDGMSATVMSTENGNTAEGKVLSIGTTPSSDSYGGMSNNPNVSYYQCTVQIPESEDFKENDFVSVSFGDGGSSQKGLFLDGMFIRSDDNGSYVYIKGKNNTLEKSYIRTGRDIGSGTMEILSGLTVKDRIAFPYGTGVEEGAKTKNATTDELYS